MRFLQHLIGNKKKNDEEMFHNIRLDNLPRVITPQGIEFHAGEFSPVVSWELKDADGNVVDRNVKKADSFLRNMLLLLRAQMEHEDLGTFLPLSEAAKREAVETNGGRFLPNANTDTFKADAPINLATWGLQIGTDNTPVTFLDYALGALVAHGTNPGQLQYSIMSFGASASDGTTSQFRLTRVFSNNSGANVIVNEAGVVVYGARWGLTPGGVSGDNIAYTMILRDILPGAPITIANGLSLTVNYQPQAVV